MSMSALTASTSSTAGVRLQKRAPSARVPARLHATKTRSEGGWDFSKLAGGRSGLAAGEKSLKTEKGKEDTFKDPEGPKKKYKWEKDLSAYETEDNPAAGEGKDDVYVGGGKYLKGDANLLPRKEDIGFFVGATGGFAGGELGMLAMRETIVANREKAAAKKLRNETYAVLDINHNALAPPLLMPGMNALVTNPDNVYHMFTGIVQRVSDGKAMLLFEGGCWDKSATFMLGDLTRSAKGPPGVNPKSAILEAKVAELKAFEEANGLIKEEAPKPEA